MATSAAAAFDTTVSIAGHEDDLMELRSVTLAAPLNRSLAKHEAAEGGEQYEEIQVETTNGTKITVAYTDDPSRRRKAAILTYHDLGLNYVSNFQAFFNYPEMRRLLQNFFVIHVNAPGQEDSAAPLGDTEEYPSVDDLAEQVNDVLNHFAIVRYIGLGVGLGGNVLIRHALRFPERVDSLLLVNALCTAPGWIEWGYQKRNITHLRQHGVTQTVLDYLLWHHFGYNPEERSLDLVNSYRHYFSNDIRNPGNLAKLTEQYIWRTAINMDRETNINQKGDTKTLKIPVLNLVGAYSPFVDDTVTLNGKLNPPNTTWMKIQDAAMVLEEQPGKVAEALLLFLQGQGYCLNVRRASAAGLN